MQTLIIDGDNVFRALGLVQGADTRAAEQFLQKLESAAACRDWRVIVVFDGPERYFPRETGLLVVRYAPGQSADTVIERIVFQEPDRSQVVVVTRDRAEENLVLGLGARVWEPRQLLDELKGESW